MKSHILLHSATDASPILIRVNDIGIACKSQTLTGATAIFLFSDSYEEYATVTETPEQIYELINN